MNVKVELTINGHKRVAEVEPRMHLADFLREHLRLTATHLGCEHGVCGACTVLINGAPARACIALTVALEGADIKTLEGLADDERMAVLKNSFHEQHGLQCGFCTPGMLISAWDLLARKPKISEREIREEMSGNLCRCTGYQGIVRSIKHAAETLENTVGT
ncbi:MAG: aerobic carbon-monoxide dehydrogenase small subunit [Methylobacteriaceae bacterium]|jgi:carbon-monoxide dehydrogenase small subunit|nr:aerobic carbon-monoxide dehydrogenase small subunit [Methylobacteriaceae bacterium]